MPRRTKDIEHDRQVLEEAKTFLKELDEFQVWKESLSPPDFENFKTLIQLPSAEEILAKCPDPEYKKWGLFAIKHLFQDKAREETARSIPKVEKVKYVKKEGQTRDHHCHFPGCGKQCPPALWGCKGCWLKLPKYLRDKVWASFRLGQEKNWTPSQEYVKVAQEVKKWIKEHYNEDGSRKET